MHFIRKYFEFCVERAYGVGIPEDRVAKRVGGRGRLGGFDSIRFWDCLGSAVFSRTYISWVAAPTRQTTNKLPQVDPSKRVTEC